MLGNEHSFRRSDLLTELAKEYRVRQSFARALFVIFDWKPYLSLLTYPSLIWKPYLSLLTYPSLIYRVNLQVNG
jgi:hypothetical protein